MNWLQKISQNINISDILQKTLMNELHLNGPGGAIEQIAMTAGIAACEEVQNFGEVNGEANAIASAIMRHLGCEGYPNAPGAQQQEEQMMAPDMMPALGEQEKPMSMPSTEIV